MTTQQCLSPQQQTGIKATRHVNPHRTQGSLLPPDSCRKDTELRFYVSLHLPTPPQITAHNIIMASSSRQNDVLASYWHYDGVKIKFYQQDNMHRFQLMRRERLAEVNSMRLGDAHMCHWIGSWLLRVVVFACNIILIRCYFTVKRVFFQYEKINPRHGFRWYLAPILLILQSPWNWPFTGPQPAKIQLIQWKLVYHWCEVRQTYIDKWTTKHAQVKFVQRNSIRSRKIFRDTILFVRMPSKGPIVFAVTVFVVSNNPKQFGKVTRKCR